MREKAIAAAALMLDVPEEIWTSVTASSSRPEEPFISLRDIADTLAGAPGYKIPSGLAPGLEFAVNFETSALTYGIGVHAVELEVDPFTGGTRLLNYVVVNDCGCIVNPMTAEGQIHGGAVHGIGNAIFEWMGFDANAQPLTTNFAEYLLPPREIRRSRSPVEYPSTKNRSA